MIPYGSASSTVSRVDLHARCVFRLGGIRNNVPRTARGVAKLRTERTERTGSRDNATSVDCVPPAMSAVQRDVEAGQAPAAKKEKKHRHKNKERVAASEPDTILKTEVRCGARHA